MRAVRLAGVGRWVVRLWMKVVRGGSQVGLGGMAWGAVSWGVGLFWVERGDGPRAPDEGAGWLGSLEG